MSYNYDFENKIAAKTFLKTQYFEQFKQRNRAIELFLLGSCKANCKYCYLKQHGNELYPKELHNYDLIVSNLEKLLNWYVENKFCCNFDIFSAEWLTTPLADRVMDLFINTFSKVNPKYRPTVILMADNMMFLKSDKYTQKVESYISRLRELGIDMYISASIDGQYCEYNRSEASEDFYKKAYAFCNKYDFRPHPMITSDNAKYWIDNYLWWRENFKGLSEELMTLEVRDDTWDENSIADLIQYCDFLIDYKWDEFHHNKTNFLKYIFDLYVQCGEERIGAPYNVIGLCNRGNSCAKDCMTCSAFNNLSIRIADLMVAPCHRLFYPELHFGKFITDDTKIIDFEPINTSLLIAYKNVKNSCLPYCENCEFEFLCPGHCHGMSYEYYGNSFVPPEGTCNLYKSKISFIIYKLFLMGLLDKEGMDYIQSCLNPLEFMQTKSLIQGVLESMGVKLEDCCNE